MNFGFGTQKNPQPLTLNEDRPRWKQVHATDLAEVISPHQECGNVDAFFTRLKGFPIAVVTADCVPLLLERKDGEAVAAIHAGWRGTYAHILEKFFLQLPSDLSDPKEWRLMIGPCIHACCYEVSAELIANFKAEFTELQAKTIEPDSRKLDLLALNCAIAENLGLEIVMIHPDCSFCSKDEDGSFKYFSYRRGDRLSRQYSMIEL
jgi:YfiH family protein